MMVLKFLCFSLIFTIVLKIQDGLGQEQFHGQKTGIQAPQIVVTMEKKNEQSNDFEPANISYWDNSTILANLHEQYRISCKAPYLIKWDVENPAYTIHTTDSIDMEREVEVVSDPATFIVSLTYEFYPSEGTSGSFICRHARDESICSKLYIFTQVGKFFSQSGQNVTGMTSLTTGEVKIVNCPSNFVQVPKDRKIDLFISLDRMWTRVDPTDYRFDPKIGFVLKPPILITRSEVEFKCVATSSGGGSEEDSVLVKYVKEDEGKGSGDQPANALSFNFPGKSPAFFCDLNTGDLDTDQISFRSIKCKNPYDCDLAKTCFKKESDCSTNVLKGIPCRSGNCSVILQSHFSGLAYCTAKNYEASAQYFVGLDFRRYKTADLNISEKALIRLDEVDPVLYNDNEAFFFCEASSFFFMPQLQFLIGYQNGSTLPLQNGTYRISNEEEYEEVQNIGTVQRRLHLNLTEDMNSVSCLAAWYNSSTEWFRTSRKFVVRKTLAPTINKSNLDRIFFLDDTERNLVCTATAQPPPVFKWLSNGTEITDESKLFSVSSTENNMESILKFPKIFDESTLAGRYTCLVSNRLGNDTATFNVKVENSELSDLEVAGIVTGLILFFGGIIIAFYVMWNKYRITKKRLRDLTKEEVAEFKQGNPAALANLTNNDGAKLVENAQFLPFNQSYEILDTDLMISKDDVLGKGAFGIVYRGRYFGEPVAVKSTLPHTDVMTFKSLLAEIKVMAYIGKHENVVTFVGAITKNIQKRIVYCVMELSPLGNLEAYLKAHRTTFISLIEADHTVTIDRTYSNLFKRLTTLDFVNWSIQIASGMEFLASIKVIHGDLATRNILLFHGHVAKITDFGLSRQLYSSSQYHKKNAITALPFRWMAMESLKDMEFSVESDVWAYGVTIWEIFTMAEIPYPGYSWTLEFMEYLEQGLRLKKPKFSSDEIYNKLLTCWHPQPQTRPSFSEMVQFFREIALQFQGEHSSPIDDAHNPAYANTPTTRKIRQQTNE